MAFEKKLKNQGEHFYSCLIPVNKIQPAISSNFRLLRLPVRCMIRVKYVHLGSQQDYRLNNFVYHYQLAKHVARSATACCNARAQCETCCTIYQWSINSCNNNGKIKIATEYISCQSVTAAATTKATRLKIVVFATSSSTSSSLESFGSGSTSKYALNV